jgi:diadenosine tetraphosphate (Ap4A) HIT family hydrolase
MTDCRFCDLLSNPEFGTTYGTVVSFSSLPAAAEGHTLIVPRRHAVTVFDLTAEEWADTQVALSARQERLNQILPDVSGWNVGWNAHPAGGQSVMHAHCHLLPRQDGDVTDPRGGILHALPNNPVLKSFTAPVAGLEGESQS